MLLALKVPTFISSRGFLSYEEAELFGGISPGMFILLKHFLQSLEENNNTTLEKAIGTLTVYFCWSVTRLLEFPSMVK